MIQSQNSFSKTSILCLLLLSSCIVCEAHLHKWLKMLMHPKTTYSSTSTCQSNCCQMTCPKLQCYPHQVMKQNAGRCGCCPKCMTQLGMGDSCQPKPENPCTNMPSSECCQGLQCRQGTCCR
ncbi:unnamed protein product [Larinioides sclopetarius]|uniref:Uncharacterized protein n=1 Tax=Larinioides sclopetarius TaxID=280406 RepID=A0AAV2AIR8_9ARAC